MLKRISINNLFNRLNQHQRLFVWIFFLGYLVLGIFIYKDYGLSWDEPFSHQNGKVSLDYALHGDPALFTYSERDYGVGFEMFLASFDRIIKFSSAQEVYFLRHLLTFLLFFTSVLVFYLLCRKRFKNTWFSLLGPLFLILSPRIFADSFYNSKDIPLLAFFIIAIFTLVNFIEKSNFKNAILHALVSAFLVTIRLPGLFIPSLTLFIFLLDFFILKKRKTELPEMAKLLSVYFFIFIGVAFLLWPFLWQSPINHFIEAFSVMSHWTRESGTQLFYFGKFIFAAIVPWHYIPTWMVITTPVSYTILFVFGVVVSLKRIAREKLDYYRNFRLDFIALCWFFVPLIIVILMKSVLYDGWRHFYFIYPAFIYLVLIGLESIISFFRNHPSPANKYFTALITTIITINLIFVSSFMIRNHPYQNLYFNFLVGGMENARKNFDLDYWGLTFRRGLEYIAKNDSDTKIRIFFQYAQPDNIDILAPEIKSKFVLVSSPNAAKYILDNYRWQDYDKLPFDKEYYSVKVDGTKVMTVFKMN